MWLVQFKFNGYLWIKRFYTDDLTEAIKIADKLHEFTGQTHYVHHWSIGTRQEPMSAIKSIA